MSGPKYGSYINYEAEIRQEIANVKGYLEELKKIVRNAENSLSLDEEEKELIKKHSLEEWEKEANSLKSYISSVKSKMDKIKNSLKVSSYNSATLSKIRQISRNTKKLIVDMRKKDADFRKRKSSIISASKKKAQEYKQKVEKELKELIQPNLSFLEEWSFDDRIKDLKDALSNFNNISFSEIETQREKILELYHTLQSVALKNKKEFEIKKDTSDKLMETLIDLNYTNIERELEDGPLGKIVVKAETPDENWSVVFEIGSDGEIKTITPYDDRCYENLKDINRRLKDRGVHVNIEKLERERKQRVKEKERERRRGR